MSLKQKFSRLERKFGAKKTDDPEGVMAVLLVGKRLIGERNDKSVYVALDEALDLSAPKDRARAWWAAHRALRHALPAGFTTIGEYAMVDSTTTEDCVELFTRAILAQGSVNQIVAKGKRP